MRMTGSTARAGRYRGVAVVLREAVGVFAKAVFELSQRAEPEAAFRPRCLVLHALDAGHKHVVNGLWEGVNLENHSTLRSITPLSPYSPRPYRDGPPWMRADSTSRSCG